MQKMKSSQHGTFYLLPSMIKPTKRHSNDTWNQSLRNNTNLSEGANRLYLDCKQHNYLHLTK